jgi:hypothetical protein
MGSRGEEVRGLASDPLRGAVGGDELGKLLLQPPKLPHELVVLGVGDLRLVQDVVAVVVMVDLLAKLLDAALGLGEASFLAGRHVPR